MAKTVKIVVRAFNADGYHRDILIMCENQVRMQDARIKETVDSVMSGLIGHGGGIVLADFPEVTHFEVVVTEYAK